MEEISINHQYIFFYLSVFLEKLRFCTLWFFLKKLCTVWFHFFFQMSKKYWNMILIYDILNLVLIYDFFSTQIYIMSIDINDWSIFLDENRYQIIKIWY